MASEIGSELRAWRMREGLSLRKVGDLLGVSGQQIAYYESGYTLPTTGALGAWAKDEKLPDGLRVIAKTFLAREAARILALAE